MKMLIVPRLVVAIALALSVLVVLVSLSDRWIRLPVRTPPKASASLSETGSDLAISSLEGGIDDSLLSDQVSLRDPIPLFLPTSLNASQLPLPMRREPGSGFSDFQPRFAFPEDTLELTVPDPAPAPSDPMEAMRSGKTQTPFAVVGVRDQLASPLPARQAVLEVFQMRTGIVVMSVALSSADIGTPLGSDFWEPMELTAVIDAIGLVGQPLIVKTSGSDVIDQFFRTFLGNTFRLGQKIPAGFYVLRIGP